MNKKFNIKEDIRLKKSKPSESLIAFYSIIPVVNMI